MGVSFLGLIAVLPVLLVFMVMIWSQDFHSPFYIAPRVGRKGKPFRMVKLRSMVSNADKSGVASTSADDKRITRLGHIIRRYKLDEFSQLWNVLIGDMSLVGPRPNVESGVKLYTPQEKHLLDMRPGITDIASIVFSDEGQILEGSDDPDLKYDQVIRPWKSRLALLYVNKRDFLIDLQIIYLTLVAIFSREKALIGVQKVLTRIGADQQLKQIATRQHELLPYPPPGTETLVSSPDNLNSI